MLGLWAGTALRSGANVNSNPPLFLSLSPPSCTPVMLTTALLLSHYFHPSFFVSLCFLSLPLSFLSLPLPISACSSSSVSISLLWLSSCLYSRLPLYHFPSLPLLPSIMVSVHPYPPPSPPSLSLSPLSLFSSVPLHFVLAQDPGGPRRGRHRVLHRQRTPT